MKALESADAELTRRLHVAAAYDQREIRMEFAPGGGLVTIDNATETRERAQAETRRVEAQQRAHEAAAAAAERGVELPADTSFDNLLR